MRALLVLILLAASLYRIAPAQAEEPQPYHLVRALQMLQNEIAKGSATAYAAQPQLVAEIATQFSRTDASAWRERRNAQAAAIFLFSGGHASQLRAIAAAKGFAPQDTPLVNGAIAYSEGRENDARRLLGPIDAMTVYPSLGGQLALAQSTLLRNTDPKRAMELLDIARLLAPGTLVEEAALRRQILMAEEPASLPRFSRLGSQYLRRFRTSVYAATMVKKMKASIIELVMEDDGPAFEASSDVLTVLSNEDRVEVDLAIARAALVKGKLVLARRAAEDVLRLTDLKDAKAQERASLYRAAALAVADGAAPSDALATLDLASFEEGDRQLAQAAAQVARWTKTSPAPGKERQAAQPAILDPESTGAKLIAKAEQSLSAATRLIAEGSR